MIGGWHRFGHGYATRLTTREVLWLLSNLRCLISQPIHVHMCPLSHMISESPSGTAKRSTSDVALMASFGPRLVAFVCLFLQAPDLAVLA